MKKLILIIFNIILSVFVITFSVFAWYTNTFGIKADNGVMSSKNLYFESGNGSKDNPYIISQPVHLYNLAWLQDLGYFDSDKDSDSSTEIKDRYYFKLKNDIDMSDFKSAIPPIGIENHPFIGDFEGAGFKISNVIIDVNFVKTGYLKPSDQVLNTSKNTINDNVIISNAVGFFGLVNSGISTDTENTSLSVRNFILDNIKIINSRKSYTGLIAGNVDGNLKNIGVLSGNINFESGINALDDSNLSEYTLVGNTSNTIDWLDKPGKVEDYVFDSSKIYDVVMSTTINGGVNFNDKYPTHNAYNQSIFNLIGELKLYEKKDFNYNKSDFLTYNDNDINISFENTNNSKKLTVKYTYEKKEYTYEENFTGYAIQFQDGLSSGNVRGDRCINFHSDGKGAIFLAYTGNAAGKQISLYKNNTSSLEKIFPSGESTSTAITQQKYLRWVKIDIDTAGDYIFLVAGGNTYLTHIHFIMSNKQGNSGGDVSSGNISNLGWVASDTVSKSDDLTSITFDKLTIVIFTLANATDIIGTITFRVELVDNKVIVYYKKNGYGGTITPLPADSAKEDT